MSEDLHVADDMKFGYMVLVSSSWAYGSHWVHLAAEDEARRYLAEQFEADPWGRFALYAVTLLEDLGPGQRG